MPADDFETVYRTHENRCSAVSWANVLLIRAGPPSLATDQVTTTLIGLSDTASTLGKLLLLHPDTLNRATNTSGNRLTLKFWVDRLTMDLSSLIPLYFSTRAQEGSDPYDSASHDIGIITSRLLGDKQAVRNGLSGIEQLAQIVQNRKDDHLRLKAISLALEDVSSGVEVVPDVAESMRDLLVKGQEEQEMELRVLVPHG